MRPTRTKLDWGLEAVALLALLAGLALVLSSWSHIPAWPRGYPPLASDRFGVRRAGFGTIDPGTRYAFQQLWSPRNALWIVGLLNIFTYIGLTLAAHYQKLLSIPDELHRQSPHLRPLMFSIVIAGKAVLMMFALYLVWAIVTIGTGHPPPVSRQTLTLLVLAIPLPLF